MRDFPITDKLEQAIHIAKAIAKEYHHLEYTSEHLLKALLHKEVGMLKYIESIGQDAYYVEEWAEVRLESLPKTMKVNEDPECNTKVDAILLEADSVKIKMGEDEVSEIAALVALVTPGVGFSFEQLKTMPLTPNEILNSMDSVEIANPMADYDAPIESNPDMKKDKSAVEKYCINKTIFAKAGKLEIISGRDSEIKMIAEILGRRSKPNVLILGEPGVGKTVMFNGLAYHFIKENIPGHLKDVTLYQLDFISLTAGAGYKGEVEDRLTKVINSIKKSNKTILLIDELNNLTEKNSGNQGIANILKSELSKGEITIITTATNDAFRKHIEPDEGLVRQFEIVKLEEPSIDDALRMISNTVNYYTKHHNLKVDNETIHEAIRLSKRYNKDRSLPDSAIDLLDRTMSAAKYMIETSQGEIDNIKEKLIELQASDKDEDFILAEQKWLYNQMKDKLSYLLFTELDDENIFDSIVKSEEGFSVLNNILDDLSKVAAREKKEIIKSDVASTIANKTGIPTGKLQADEKEKLLNMEEQLQKRVIGQDHAIKVITEAVLESRSGLSKPGLPTGSFFFSGPTGTGKTELAKALAEFLFQTETSIIRLDMSEFKEEHSAALLYGAPPGYVGYEEGGLLVNKIREKPYSIVLFDEIEKAHPSVFDIFLQILDEGKLHDRLGKEGDFSNAVILFTSNIGSDHIVESFGRGVIPKSNDLLEMMSGHFRPEFLGRLTEIIPFSPITENNIVKIFNIQLKDLKKALEKQDITLDITDEATEYLAKKGFTPKYGARPLRGVIRSDLRSPLSKMLISGELVKGTDIKLELLDGELKWNF